MLWTGAQICSTVLKSFPKFSPVLIRMDIIVNLEKVLHVFQKETYLKFFLVVRQVEIRAVHSCTLTFD